MCGAGSGHVRTTAIGCPAEQRSAVFCVVRGDFHMHERVARTYMNRAPSYNTGVPTARPRPERSSKGRPGPPKSRVVALEAGGILLICALILIFTLARTWHHIAWGAR